MTCPACGTPITDSAPAIVAAVPHMRFRQYVCPSCGCENFEVDGGGDERTTKTHAHSDRP